MNADDPTPAEPAPGDRAAGDAAWARLDAALDLLAARAATARASLDARGALPGPAANRAEFVALADRLDATLARLRAAAEPPVPANSAAVEE